jgi:hypothetical protein
MVMTSPQQKKEKKRFPSKINVSVSPVSNAPPPSKVISKGTLDPSFNFLLFLDGISPVQSSDQFFGFFKLPVHVILTKIYLQEKSKENSSLLIEININSKSAKETMKNHLRKLHLK